jgi:hypothetical protein
VINKLIEVHFLPLIASEDSNSLFKSFYVGGKELEGFSLIGGRPNPFSSILGIKTSEIA